MSVSYNYRVDNYFSFSLDLIQNQSTPWFVVKLRYEINMKKDSLYLQQKKKNLFIFKNLSTPLGNLKVDQPVFACVIHWILVNCKKLYKYPYRNRMVPNFSTKQVSRNALSEKFI